MKKNIIPLLIVVVTFLYSCNDNQSKELQKEQTTIEAENNTKAVDKKDVEIKTENPKGKPVLLSKKDFLEKVMDFEKNPEQWIFKGDLPCIIDFYADWCGPCRKAAPILDELAKEYDGKINIYKIDTQVEQELASAFGIQSIPAFLYCPKEGKPTMANGIGRTQEDTKKMFVDAIESILLNNKK